MISDIIKFLHAQVSEVLLGFIIVIALLSFFISLRRFRMEQYAAKKRPDTGASEGTLRALLHEIQSMPQGASPSQPVSLEQLTDKDRVRLEREVQQKMAEAGDSKSAEGAEVLKQIREKDSELLRLQGKIKELQVRLDEAGGESAESPSNLAEIEHLQSKIQDLEARLKEYEIIEDDIADLSTYKEENARLKEMLEAQGMSLSEDAATSPAPEATSSESQPSVQSTASISDQEAAPAQESVQDDSSPASASAPADGGVDEESGTSPEDQEPAVQVDADQLLSEVDELLTLGEKEMDEASALDEDLNTDKLLQEAKDMPGDQAGE